MNMTLFYGEPNGPSFTVLAALHEKALDAECVRIDLTRGERYLRSELLTPELIMSVEGEGPVLLVDGEPMVDSVFIGCFLDEISETGSLVPGDSYKRWEVMTWCRNLIERLAPAAAFIGTRAYLADELAKIEADTYANITAPIGSDDLRERWDAVRANDFPEDKLVDSQSKVKSAVEKIENALAAQTDGQWILGEFSLVDLEAYAWLAGMVALEPETFVNAPQVTAWLARVKARPAVQKALAMATSTAPEKVWAPGPEINRWG